MFLLACFVFYKFKARYWELMERSTIRAPAWMNTVRVGASQGSSVRIEEYLARNTHTLNETSFYATSLLWQFVTKKQCCILLNSTRRHLGYLQIALIKM
jgi:hypothetical protein